MSHLKEKLIFLWRVLAYTSYSKTTPGAAMHFLTQGMNWLNMLQKIFIDQSDKKWIVTKYSFFFNEIIYIILRIKSKKPLALQIRWLIFGHPVHNSVSWKCPDSLIQVIVYVLAIFVIYFCYRMNLTVW